ncbi:hypothetical protein CANARDRAFT_29872 [[Candida] arabinofermentans NRRL YB-2248]|uniref:Uncharacterized protein n=1 Tax=[Candida] arabinofermentans NRRL YB-2248 TaxID=983967 RepID=A0A1E4SVX3_9ASCO|nr:hypothetical protein CANARDRAFT_29872 [[Candida] arabinofermentans NRRL YB-2248]
MDHSPSLNIQKQRSKKVIPIESPTTITLRPTASNAAINKTPIFSSSAVESGTNKKIQKGVADKNLNQLRKQIDEKLNGSIRKRKLVDAPITASIPRQPGSKPSRLDLLDSSQLTSLPFAHPKPNNNINININTNPSSISTAEDQPTINLSSSLTVELNSPLVMIEDYINEPHSLVGGSHRPGIKKSKKTKLSIMDLKRAMYNQDNIQNPQQDCFSSSSCSYFDANQSDSWMISEYVDSSSLRPVKSHSSATETLKIVEPPSFHSPSDAVLSRHTVSSSSSDFLFDHHPSSSTSSWGLTRKISESTSICNPDDQSEFSNSRSLSLANSKSSLKYCVVCEKPLYDISSLIPSSEKFEEIVCSDCFADYEDLTCLLRKLPDSEILQLYNHYYDNVDDEGGDEDDPDNFDSSFQNSTLDDTINNDITDNDINDTIDTIKAVMSSKRLVENSKRRTVSNDDNNNNDDNNKVFNVLITKLREIQETDLNSRVDLTKNISKKSILDLNQIFNKFKSDQPEPTGGIDSNDNFIIRALKAIKLFGTHPPNY